MKKLYVLSLLTAAIMMLGVQNSYAKKVLVCTNGASAYHTWNKCADLKSCGLSAKVNEKDAIRDGKSFCPICKQHEADVEAQKAQKKQEKAQKKAEQKVKKQQKAAKKAEKAQKKAENEAKKIEKAQKKALKEAEKAANL